MGQTHRQRVRRGSRAGEGVGANIGHNAELSGSNRNDRLARDAADDTIVIVRGNRRGELPLRSRRLVLGVLLAGINMLMSMRVVVCLAGRGL